MIKELTGNDSKVHIMKLDVSCREDVSEVTKAVHDHFGPVDIVINNAGIMQNAKV